MLKAFINMWRIPELRNKLLFTLGMLAIYRVGFFVPLPGVNQESLTKWAQGAAQEGSGTGNVIQFMNIFSGGALHQSTIFGLGVMPYISASIIFQLLATVLPPLQALKKEGAAGYQKITEWTRYATLVLCLIQGGSYLGYLQFGMTGDPSLRLVYSEYLNTPTFWACGLLGLTAGTVFLMWLGEQIDKYGLGNGVSLIITANIVGGMGRAVTEIAEKFTIKVTSDPNAFHLGKVLLIAAAFILVVAGSIAMTQGQHRIPIQQAKHTRGRKVYGGQKTYLPLRVNHGGVMPVIFANSLMMFPAMFFNWLHGNWNNSVTSFLSNAFSSQQAGFVYIVTEVAMIYFFSFFWTTVQFQPKEMATQLRDHGSFIPGLRPGPRTAEYLETVMERITYVGASFLSIIAVIPVLVAGAFKIPFNIATFLGGTGLLIVISVMLDFVQRVEANLLMRNYQGFLGATGGSKGKRIRGARGAA